MTPPPTINASVTPISSPIGIDVAVSDALAASMAALLTSPVGPLPAGLRPVSRRGYTRVRLFGRSRSGSSFSVDVQPQIRLLGVNAWVEADEIRSVEHAAPIGDPITVRFDPSAAIACDGWAHHPADTDFVDALGFSHVLALLITPMQISGATTDPAPSPQIGMELLT